VNYRPGDRVGSRTVLVQVMEIIAVLFVLIIAVCQVPVDPDERATAQPPPHVSTRAFQRSASVVPSAVGTSPGSSAAAKEPLDLGRGPKRYRLHVGHVHRAGTPGSRGCSAAANDVDYIEHDCPIGWAA